MDTPLDFAAALARESGDLLLDYFSTDGTKARLKADRSLVTEADLAADRLITQSILDRYPQDEILSEELQHSVSNQAGSIWVIDPLDGTTNFSLGLHYWGVLITRLKDGWPEVAALYFPLLDELYSAQRNGGASFNGMPLHAKPPDKNTPLNFFSCCSRTFRRYEVSVRYKSRILGSAAYTMCAVARGMAILGFEATPKIWDIAGGWLLLSEAGGVVETLDNSKPFPIVPGRDYKQINFPTIMAPTPEVAARARERIQLK